MSSLLYEMWDGGSFFNTFAWKCPIALVTLLKRSSFLARAGSHLCQRSGVCVGLALSSARLHGPRPTPSRPCCLDRRSDTVSLASAKYCFHSFFFVRIFLAILGPVLIHISFQNKVIYVCERPCWVVDRNYIQHMYGFGENCIVTMLRLPIHKHSVSLHLFRSPLISLPSIFYF